MSQLTDQRYLKEQQYKNADNLHARISLHLQFSTNKYPWQRWVFEHLELCPNMQILEIGTGPGGLWSENLDLIPEKTFVFAGDYSIGMVMEARKNIGTIVRYVNLDAQAVPLSSKFFDRVIANHMIYHIPDIPVAISEFSRVLKTDGRLYAATNGQNHLRELRQLICKFLPEYNDYQPQASSRFSIENASDILGEEFEHVEVYPFISGLEITDCKPLLAYIKSMWDIPEKDEALFEEMSKYVQVQIDKEGSFHISQSSGLVIAYNKDT